MRRPQCRQPRRSWTMPSLPHNCRLPHVQSTLLRRQRSISKNRNEGFQCLPFQNSTLCPPDPLPLYSLPSKGLRVYTERHSIFMLFQWLQWSQWLQSGTKASLDATSKIWVCVRERERAQRMQVKVKEEVERGQEQEKKGRGRLAIYTYF